MDPTSLASASASLLGVTIQIIGSLYGDWDHSSRLLAERLIYELSRLRNLLQSLEVATLAVTEAVIVPRELLIAFQDVKYHLVTLGSKLLAQDSTEVFSFSDYELPWRSFNAPRSAQSTRLLSTSADTLDEIEQLKSVISKLRDRVGEAGFITGDPATKPIVDPAGALWRDCADYAAAHQSAREVREEGTGLWFIRRQAFRRWLVGERSANTLFCPGVPGFGKTILMSQVIDEVRRWQQDNPSSEIGLAYFYFSYTKPNSIQSVGLTLLRQLYLQSSSAVDQVTQLEALAANSEPLTLQAIIGALLACAGQFPKTYIIIDALDECSSDNIPDLLTLLASLKDSLVRLMASSRFDLAFVNFFERSPWIEVCPSSEDIALYVQTTLGRVAHLVSHPKLYDEIVTKLIRAAGSEPMFLLTVLQVASISRLRTTPAIRQCLEQLPRELGSLYGETLARILQQPSGEVDLALKALTWLHHARRPLQTAELLDIIQFENSSDSPPPVSMIVEVCQGLLYEHTDTVTFMHFSVKEYLETMTDIQSDVVKPCLLYLRSLCLHEVRSPYELKSLHRGHPFLAYAATYWGFHARNPANTEEDNVASIRKLCMDVLKEEGVVANLCQLVFAPPEQVSAKGGYNFFFLSSWLHLVAYFGLSWAIKPPLFETISEAAVDELGRTPLHLAAANDHHDCVKLLLRPESMNAKDDYGRTVWHYTAMSGNAETMRFLVSNLHNDNETGYDKEAFVYDSLGPDRGGKSPLEYAAVASDSRVFSLILPLYAKSTSQYKGKALKAALEAGKADPISLLMSEGEPIQYDYLLEAVRSGFDQAVQIFLENGTELENPDSQGYSAVLEATRNARNKILQLLIWNGADVDRAGPDGENALACAVEAGNEEATRILLRAGVNPDEAMILQRRSILYAAAKGEVAIVEMLLNAGADTDGVAMAATRAGQVEVLEKLESLGLLPSPTTREGRQLVAMAGEAGRLSVLSVLQPRGIEASSQPVYSVPYEESIIESEIGDDEPPDYERHEPPQPAKLDSIKHSDTSSLKAIETKEVKTDKPAASKSSAAKIPDNPMVRLPSAADSSGPGLPADKPSSRAKSVHVRQSGLTDEIPFVLLSDPIPADQISLGSIVVDFRNPLAAYAPNVSASLRQLVGDNLDQSLQHNYQARKHHESTSGFALEMLKSFMSSKSNSIEQSETSLASEEVRRLQLRNHEQVLTRILTDALVGDEVLTIAKSRGRKELYIVVGLLEAKRLHTRMLKHTSANLGSPLMSMERSASRETEMRHEGSSIFAISYRVIKIKTRNIPGFSKKVDIFFDHYVQPKAYERLQ